MGSGERLRTACTEIYNVRQGERRGTEGQTGAGALSCHPGALTEPMKASKTSGGYCGTVAPGRGQGVVDVDDADDLGALGNLFSPEAIGIAGAVHLLVVPADQRLDVPGKFHAAWRSIRFPGWRG